MCACRFEHEAVASLLLERSIALDPELGTHVDGSGGRLAFIRCFDRKWIGGLRARDAVGPWKVFVMEQVTRAIHDGDLTAFVRGLQREPWLLGEEYVWFQAGLIEVATLNDRGEFITALLDLDPAILRRQPPPPSQAIEFAFTYAKTHLIPLLTRIWPLPDDLPHAAGMGDLSRVKQWFDASGAPALGDLEHHYPYNDPRARGAPASGPAHVRSRCSTRRSPGPSSTATSTWRTSSWRTAQISTPRGAPMSRRASCTSWSFGTTTSRCDSSSTAAST